VVRVTSDRATIRTVGLVLLCAKVTLVPIAFDLAALTVFPGPKSLVAHELALALLGILILDAIRARGRLLGWTAVHAAVIVFGAIAAVATVFALDRSLALFGAFDRRLGLVTILDGIVTFFAVAAFARSPRERGILFASIAGAALAVIAYEAVQVTGNDPFPWASGVIRERPFATFGNADALGQYLGTLSAASLAVAALPDPRMTTSARVRILAVAAAILAGALATNTRAIVAGYAAAAAVVAALYVVRTPSVRVRIRIALAAIVLVIVATTLGRAQIRSALDAMLELAPQLTEEHTVTARGSAGARAVIYRVAADIVSDRPILGVGPDNYVAAFAAYRPREATSVLATTASETSTHSWVLYLATSTGILGLIAFLAVVGLAVWRALPGLDPTRLAALAGLSAFLANGIVTIDDVGTAWLPWVFIGLMAAEAVPVPPAPDERPRPRRGRAERAGGRRSLVVVVAGLIIAATLAGAVVEARAWGAARAAEAARVARAQGDGAGAVLAAEKATDQDPRRAEHWNGLGLGFALQGRFDRAATAFKRAADMAPYEPTYASNLVRAYVALGPTRPELRQTAVDLALEAIDRNPNVPDLYNTLALAYFASGKAGEGAAAAEHAVASGAIRSDGLVEQQTGRYYSDQGRLADAEKWLRSAINDLKGRAAFDARVLLAQVYLRQGRPRDALAMVNTVLEVDPSYEPALRVKATIPPPP
jgi:O-antigen ligase/Tfp pilus assembly protein PilF